jgi:hypothetical protein
MPMMARTIPRPRKNMPMVPKGDAALFPPSGREAPGFRLPEPAAIAPRRMKPTPKTRKVWFNGAMRRADGI